MARPGPLHDLPRLLDCSTVRKYFSELRGIVFQLLKASSEKVGAWVGEKDSSGSFVVLLSLFYVCAAQKEDGGRS